MKRVCPEKQSGFTLIELIVSMVVIGILSYVVVANYGDSYTHVQYKAMIQKIASDVRYARQLALTDGQRTSVFIDESHNRYFLKWADGSYVQNPLKGGDFIVQLGQKELNGVQITMTGFSGGRLDFTTSGEPLNGGNSFTGKLTLVVLNNAKKISVTGGTGFIKIENQ